MGRKYLFKNLLIAILLLLLSPAWAQTISDKEVEDTGGEAEANVKAKNSSISTMTDIDGNFTLQLAC